MMSFEIVSGSRSQSDSNGFMKICSKLKPVTMHWIIYGLIQKEYWCLIWNMNMQSASSIWSNLLSNATVNIIENVRNCVRGGEANVYGSSYYWNFRTSSFKQVACLILAVMNQSWKSKPYLVNINCSAVKQCITFSRYDYYNEIFRHLQIYYDV